MKVRSLPWAILLVLPAACGGEASAPNAATETAEAPIENRTTAPAAAPVQENVQMPPFAEVDNAHPYGAPPPAPIPAAFRGTWAESKALCGDLAHHNRLGISGATVRFPKAVTRVDSVDTLGPRAINIFGHPEDGDTAQRIEHHFILDAAGDTLTDGAGGGMVRVRCSG